MSTHYKYLKRKHAIKMVEQGIVRIGTLYDYRKTELFGKEIGDKQEGTKNILTHGNIIDSSKKNMMPYTMAAIQEKIHAEYIFLDISDSLTFTVPNTYVYSTSLIKDINVLQQMNSDIDLGYDTCVEINDGEYFFEALTKSIKEKTPSITLVGYGTCVYTPRSTHFPNENNYEPALIKDPNYSYQQEHRAFWTNPKSQLEPFIVRSPYICKYCHIVEL